MNDTSLKPKTTKIKHRFWAQQQLRPGAVIQLDAAESLHASKSLRIQAEDLIEVWNGQQVCNAQVAKIQSGIVFAKLLEYVDLVPLPLPYLHLFAPLIKLERFEWMIEKATELGVNEITPVKYDFSQVNLVTAVAKMSRWEKLIIEAGKQSKAGILPILNTPSDLNIPKPSLDVINFYGSMDFNVSRKEYTSKQKVNLFIGPEGGFSPVELEELATLATPLNIPGNILKAETAAIAAIVSLRVIS